MRKKYYIIYSCAFILGFFISGELTGILHKNQGTDTKDWIYRGKICKKLMFTEYSAGLFMSDKTVTEADTSIINTPKLAGDIAVAILEDVFDSATVSDNYPFEIHKDIYSWDIQGLCFERQKEENILYLDLSKEIGINRKNGMVTFLSH